MNNCSKSYVGNLFWKEQRNTCTNNYTRFSQFLAYLVEIVDLSLSSWESFIPILIPNFRQVLLNFTEEMLTKLTMTDLKQNVSKTPLPLMKTQKSDHFNRSWGKMVRECPFFARQIMLGWVSSPVYYHTAFFIFHDHNALWIVSRAVSPRKVSFTFKILVVSEIYSLRSCVIDCSFIFFVNIMLKIYGFILYTS